MARLIACLTDFGTRGHYVGAMKGVIASIAPDAQVIDLTHDVLHFAVTEGALTLALAAAEFPPGTIFLAVVDPGVGTSRRAVAARTADGCSWVGPDNGLLWPAIEQRGLVAAHSLENPELRRLGPISATFHGRDLFAPAAAHLARGVRLEAFGPTARDLVRLELPEAKQDGARLIGRIQRIDEFGNLITTISRQLLEQIGTGPERGTIKVSLSGGGALLLPFRESYATAERGEALALIDSSGYLELACNQASFADLLGGQRGDAVIVECHSA